MVFVISKSLFLHCYYYDIDIATLFDIAGIKLMEVLFNYQLNPSVPFIAVILSHFEINNSLKNWKKFLWTVEIEDSAAIYYNLRHILSCIGYVLLQPLKTPSIHCLSKIRRAMTLWWKLEVITLWGSPTFIKLKILMAVYLIFY